MKILYVGGIYHVEYSLYMESKNNPNIEVYFCQEEPCVFEYMKAVSPIPVNSRLDIDNVHNKIKPDLVLFRNWCPTEKLINSDEVLWNQEICPTRADGSVAGGGPVYKPKAETKIAYQSKPMSVKRKGFWMPYCVSRFWGKLETKVEKDIPVMMATNLPSMDSGGDMKLRSMNILIKPIIEWNRSLVHVFAGFYGGLDLAPYLAPCIKPSFSTLKVPNMVSRAKIYVSPTCIWYDEGCVSHKTLEAMACGAFVITNNYIDMEDVFGKDGEYLVYANTPEESLDKIRYYLDHDKEREAIAERAFEFATTEYAWEKHLFRLKQEVG